MDSQIYGLSMKEGICMLQIELYEMKMKALKWWRHFNLPYFTTRGWKLIIGGAFFAGGAVGVLIAIWILAVRGLI